MIIISESGDLNLSLKTSNLYVCSPHSWSLIKAFLITNCGEHILYFHLGTERHPTKGQNTFIKKMQANSNKIISQIFSEVAMRRKISMQRWTTWPTTQLSVPIRVSSALATTRWPSTTTSSTTWWSAFLPGSRSSPRLWISTKQTYRNKKTSTHSMPSVQCIGHKKSTCNSRSPNFSYPFA